MEMKRREFREKIDRILGLGSLYRINTASNANECEVHLPIKSPIPDDVIDWVLTHSPDVEFVGRITFHGEFGKSFHTFRFKTKKEALMFKMRFV